MPSHWKKVRLGSRIAVYFKNPGCYYACKVIDKETDSRNCSNFLVRYEDNSELWTDLARSKFRWQDYYVTTDDEEEELIYSSDEEDDEEESTEDDDEEEEKKELPIDKEVVKKGVKMFIDEEALEVNEKENPSDKDSISHDDSEVGSAASNDRKSHKICNSKSKNNEKENRKFDDEKVDKGSENLEEEDNSKESEKHKDEDSYNESDIEMEEDGSKGPNSSKDRDEKSEVTKNEDSVQDKDRNKESDDKKEADGSKGPNSSKDRDRDEKSEVTKNEDSVQDKDRNRESDDKKEANGSKGSKSPKDGDSDEKSEAMKDEESNKESEERPTIDATIKRSDAPKQTKRNREKDIKDEDDGSEATPTTQSEKDDSNIVTPPPAKRPKMTSMKSKNEEGRKLEESDEGDEDTDENMNDCADDDMRSESNDGKAKDDDEECQDKLKKGIKEKANPAKKEAKKSARKESIPPLLSNNAKLTPKNLPKINDTKKAYMNKEISEENALLSIMFVNYTAGNKSLAFERILSDLGYNEENKGLETTWKDLRSRQLVEEAARGKKKVCRLTQKGIDVISSKDNKDGLGIPQKTTPPKTTSELHERIRADTVNEYGKQIFDLLLEARGKSDLISTDDAAKKCGVGRKAKKFICAMKQLKNNGYVIHAKTKKKNLILSEKCFLDD